MMVQVPPEERDKLYAFIPRILFPILVISGLILGILFFDVFQGYVTNPVVFFGLPFLYQFVFLTKDTGPILLRTLGLYFPTTRSKIVGLISIPTAYFVGWGLVQIATRAGSIFQIATYPWVASTFALASVSALATYTPLVNIVLYATVGIFEESTSLHLGKNISNWFFHKGVVGLNASILGLLLGRLLLVFYHIFSYGGFSEIGLYISAMAMFIVFTGFSVFFGLLANGFKLEDSFGNKGGLPVMIIFGIIAHFSFDFTLSQLMIIVNNLIISIL